MIDASEGDAEERFATIDHELAAYGAGLDERPQAIVLNKTDLLGEPPRFELEDDRIVRVFRISCATGAGVEELRRVLFELVPARAAAGARRAGVARLPRLPPEAGGTPRLPHLPHRARLPRHGHPPEGEELEAALRTAGVRKGVEVEIGDEVLEWQ